MAFFNWSPGQPRLTMAPIWTALTVPTALVRRSLMAALTVYPPPTQIPGAPIFSRFT